ncbi:flavin reductase family protein [Donghicola sp. C2-DW-16]|uniref:Flavin reductase family protein n=1 Tax=Donghicola mangrovi TaxID=2729614 RepID=A0ABX2PIR2_9RHOB|nr:flavin reductase family protein [Donghicola mangrovi]NVO28882.1 flavin reductase family protein [Donghicola mangrovi]
MTAFDPRALRSAFGRFMTGVTVVTARTADGTPVGFTANSFTSVSMDPPLLLVCPGKFLSTYDTFASCTAFAISILAEGQENTATTFASFKGDRFAAVPHTLDARGIPLIDGAIATFSCTTHSATAAGDHTILIGQVTDFTSPGGRGLGYANGQFFSLGLERSARDPSAKVNLCGAVLRYMDRVLLEQTDQGYRLPLFQTPDRMGLRDTLAAGLAARHVAADLGPVYSVYEDAATGEHFTWLLAKVSAVEPASGLVAVPIDDLPGLRFASAPVGRMMARFAAESRTRDFTLYLGDADRGDIHALQERG